VLCFLLYWFNFVRHVLCLCISCIRVLLCCRIGVIKNNNNNKTCKAPVKSSPPTIQQHPVFLQAGCPSCRPTNSVKALKEKASHFMDLITSSSRESLPTLSLTTKGSWLPLGRVVKPVVSPQPVLQRNEKHAHLFSDILTVARNSSTPLGTPPPLPINWYLSLPCTLAQYDTK